jgi:23S rRNA pseudouridine955/2504/2580 synthase
MNITIWVNESNQRFDRFLRKYFRSSSFITLTQIYSRIRKGQVKVNSRKQDEKYMLILDDVVMIHDRIVEEFHLGSKPKNTSPSLHIEQIRKQLIYEDENWIVWNKPPHLLIHPAHDLWEITLNDYLESYCAYQSKNKPDNSTSSTFKASFWFRLDKDTSWVIIWAKNYLALQYVNEQIRLRNTIKRYIAVVSGTPKQTIDMQEPLFKWFSDIRGKAEVFVNREKWLESHTVLTPVLTTQDPYLGPISVVLLRLHTGRMHQIRVHCAYHGFPIIGDLIYGSHQTNTIAHKKHHITRQLLHCYHYGLPTYPSSAINQWYHRFTAPIPTDIIKLFDQNILQKRIDQTWLLSS